MIGPATLLAKKWGEEGSPPEAVRLVDHLHTCANTGEAILESIGEHMQHSLGLDSDIWRERFRTALRWACLSHDLGKANSAFQSIVCGRTRDRRQPIRHEFLSTLMVLPGAPLHKWMSAGLAMSEPSDPLYRSVLGAISGHHVKCDLELEKAAPFKKRSGLGTELYIYLNHPDLEGLPEWRRQESVVFPLSGDSHSELSSWLSQFRDLQLEWVDFLAGNDDWRRFAGALKGLVMSADVLASAMPAAQDSPGEWARETLTRVLDTGGLEAVIHERLGSAALRPFQAEIGGSTARVTLVQAGCGTGKTLAAYVWALRHAVGKKLFFCYPTTGTATEGYLGYVANGQVEADLIHSRSEVDLEGISDSGDEDSGLDQEIAINSLRTWDPAVGVCTADTVLALARNGKKGLYSTPAFLNASYVFDEVHSYDPQMFAGMMALMKALPGAHFLLMSASLPRTRLDTLEKSFPDQSLVPSPKDLENLVRYIPLKVDEQVALREMADTLGNGGKVLWVVNTVDRAQKLWERFDKEGLPAIAYHSRFRYCDRVERHRGVIDGFKKTSPMVAVTTQVAEMSLDLDADLLITEIAPVSSLIQRMGRLNRRVNPDKPGQPRKALFLTPAGEAPYSKDELVTAGKWLGDLIAMGHPISQLDLTRAFEDLPSEPEQLGRGAIEWLDMGLCCEPGTVREPGRSVSVLLEEDYLRCREMPREGAGREKVRVTIPLMLDEKRMQDWTKWRHCFVAPKGSVVYDTKGGLKWARK